MAKKKNKNKNQEQDQSASDVLKCLACGKEGVSEEYPYCNSSCEIVYLKGQVASRDEKLTRFNRRKEAPKCHGIINFDWSACTQEWYSKRSWDAKRRGNELRKLGFEVRIKGIGEMPMSNGNGETEMVGMTVLTCDHMLHDGKLVEPPAPVMYQREEAPASK